MQKTIKIKVNKTDNVIREPLWITQEIKDEIKVRKHYNRIKRNIVDVDKKREYEEKYKDQKLKVQLLVKEAMGAYEIKITNEIREDKDRTKLWDNINKLKGKEISKKELVLYTENGKTPIIAGEIGKALEIYWSGIYMKIEFIQYGTKRLKEITNKNMR